MNESDLRTKASEESDMLNVERNRYRRAFWIALSATVVLAIVALILWWRLNHAATASQTGNNSASSEPMAASCPVVRSPGCAGLPAPRRPGTERESPG